MYLVLFAFVTVAGGWAAWRRNPMYSARSTLKFLFLVIPAIAVVIGLIIAAANLTAGRSPAFIVATMGGAVLFGTLALIFLIQTLSTPRPAGLPPSIPLVHFHRQRVYKWIPRLGIVIVLVLCSLLIPGNAKYIVVSIGGLAIFLGLVMLPTFYLTSRNADRALTALEHAPWVHWQYSPAQWEEWCNTQAERTRAIGPTHTLKRNWPALVSVDLLVAVLAAVYIPLSAPAKIFYGLFIFTTLFAAVAQGWRQDLHAPDRLKATLHSAVPEAYLGPDGIFCNGVLTSWLDPSNFVVTASLDERPPRSLVFQFDRTTAGYIGQQITQVSQCVLIPDDSAATKAGIARLQQELAAKCPTATIHLV